MKEEKVVFKNKKGEKMVGLLGLPEKEKPPILIIIHGFKGDKDYYELFDTLVEVLVKEGFATLRFDCRGTGESDGEFIDMTFASEVEDLKTALEYVKTLDVDKNKIALIGTSMGANIAIMGYNEDVKCLVLFNTSFKVDLDFYKRYEKELDKKGYILLKREIDKKEFKTGRGWYEERIRIDKDIVSYLKKIKSPTICIVGSEDDYNSPDYSKKFIDLIDCTRDFKVIEGGGHTFRKKEVIDKALSFTLDWLRKYL